MRYRFCAILKSSERVGVWRKRREGRQDAALALRPETWEQPQQWSFWSARLGKARKEIARVKLFDSIWLAVHFFSSFFINPRPVIQMTAR
jgi:hypothetical protein